MKKNTEHIFISSFKHKTPIQIRYVDLDMQGHVNNATFLSYIEQGRVEYLNKLFPDNNFKKTGVIIAKTEINYFEPIFLNEQIYCYTRIPSIGNKSFIFENIIADNENKIKCHAKSVMVCFDYIKNTTIPIPEKWRKVIENFEK